jgi:hypothetical protein
LNASVPSRRLRSLDCAATINRCRQVKKLCEIRDFPETSPASPDVALRRPEKAAPWPLDQGDGLP